MKTMRDRLTGSLRDEHGKVLILALMFLLLGALLLTPLLGLMSTGLTAGSVYENRAHSLYAADAGVEDAVNWLLEGKHEEWPWTGDEGGPWERDQGLEVNHHDVNITVAVHGAPDDHTYKITSESINGGSGTTVIAIVMVQPRFQGCYLTGSQTFSNQNEPLPEVDIIVVGTVNIQHNQTVDGHMTIYGDLNMTNQASIDADKGICVQGTVRMANNTKINADLLVSEDLIFTNPAEVNGNVFIFGDIDIGSNADINGNVYAYGDITIKLGAPNARIHGAVYSTGTVTIDPANRAENVGTIHEDQDPDHYPDQPDCLQVDSQGTIVDTYHVMGYGG